MKLTKTFWFWKPFRDTYWTEFFSDRWMNFVLVYKINRRSNAIMFALDNWSCNIKSLLWYFPCLRKEFFRGWGCHTSHAHFVFIFFRFFILFCETYFLSVCVCWTKRIRYFCVDSCLWYCFCKLRVSFNTYSPETVWLCS